MFEGPEPEVPEEIKDLLVPYGQHSIPEGDYNSIVIEAYRRGQKSFHYHLTETEIDMAALHYIGDINAGMDIKSAIGKTLRWLEDYRRGQKSKEKD